MSEQFDLIVLGSGSAARDGANKAARELGATVHDLARMHHAFRPGARA
ncbi:MAG TPA: hypothetical protein VFM13_01840 [Gaiellaceae bacterium]|nr:hypothetical protein [Gaiellaceae bacterium]